MSTDTVALRPVHLSAEHLYGIRRVDIDFDANRNLFILTGPNGAGKTSVVNALWFCLLGASAPKRGDSSAVIHDEADYGLAEVTLSNGVVVSREAVRGADGKPKYNLLMKTADGARYPNANAMLKKMLGDLVGVDPLAFASARPEEQVEMLLATAGLSHVVGELDRQIDALAEIRVQAGRDRERAKGALEDLGPIDETAPSQMVDVAALLDEYRAAVDHNAARNRLLLERDEADGRLSVVRTKIEEMERQIRVLKHELDTVTADRAAAERARDEMPVLDVAAIKAHLDSASATNEIVRANDRRLEKVEEYTRYASQWDKCQQQILGIRDQKTAALASAELPHHGLRLDVDPVDPSKTIVLWQGKPVAWASYSQKLEAGVAVAMTGRATVKLLTIEQGDALDDQTLSRIVDLANEHGYLVVVQRVRESWEGRSIHLVDGEVYTPGSLADLT